MQQYTQSVPRLLAGLVLLLALLFAVVAAGVFGIRAYLDHRDGLGDCTRIGLCSGTPLATVERRTGVDLPDGSTRITARAARDGHYLTALVELPDGTKVPALGDAQTVPLDERAGAALDSVSATDRSAHRSQHGSGTVLLASGSAAGRDYVYVRYDEGGTVAP